jgi:hypothetical protein
MRRGQRRCAKKRRAPLHVAAGHDVNRLAVAVRGRGLKAQKMAGVVHENAGFGEHPKIDTPFEIIERKFFVKLRIRRRRDMGGDSEEGAAKKSV